MTLLVTGSDGLVGSALRSINPIDTYFATKKDADLRDMNQTLELFNRVNPTRVIHLAALVGGIGGNLMHSSDYFLDNLLINTNTLEAARKLEVKKLVSFMSTCVFPNEGPYPLKPSSLHSGHPHPSNFGYAYAKRMLEVQTRAYRAQWNMEYCVGIPTNIYGPGDNFNLNEGHVVPALIHKTYLAMKNNQPLRVWGSGKPLREFIYSLDIAKLAIWMIDEYQGTEPLILSPGQETSISDVVNTITQTMGFQGEVIYDTSKPDGQLRKPSDNSELLALRRDFHFTKFSDGIDKTVEWFIANYPKVRK
jgi:GDP-L-fucose synthase